MVQAIRQTIIQDLKGCQFREEAQRVRDLPSLLPSLPRCMEQYCTLTRPPPHPPVPLLKTCNCNVVKLSLPATSCAAVPLRHDFDVPDASDAAVFTGHQAWGQAALLVCRGSLTRELCPCPCHQRRRFSVPCYEQENMVMNRKHGDAAAVARQQTGPRLHTSTYGSPIRPATAVTGPTKSSMYTEMQYHVQGERSYYHNYPSPIG